jgi:glutamyl-tRNA synthetase
LRIEDLDGPRVQPGAADRIRDDLAWLGLSWDEGPDLGGPHAPYAQSERLDRYEAALVKLRDEGLSFECSCSRKELRELASAPHGPAETAYPGTCRAGPTKPERAQAVRFRMTAPEPFDDALHGPVAPMTLADDFVLRRRDGLFAYQLAVVVDDAAMGITEVVRGDDLLPSTPRQIALYRALGLPVPAFFHLPLVLGPDGERLAKRHGAVAIADYRDRGDSPEQVLGALAASLGLLPPGSRTTAADLAARFDPALIPHEPVRLDF